MHRTIFAASFVLLLLPGSPALPEELSGPEISFPALKEYLDTGKRSPGLLEELNQIHKNSSGSSPEYKALEGLLKRAGQKSRFQFLELMQREGLIGPASPGVRPAIGRVRIHSVEVVDRRAATAEPWNREPPKQQLKVSFSVEGDLFGYLRSDRYDLGVDFGFCTVASMGRGRPGPRENLDNHPYVYDDNGIVNSFRKDIAEGARQPPGHLFRAYVYMQHERNDWIPRYDLWREPKDVCLQLTGSNMVGSSFRTQWMYIISERTISEAIARARLP